jgi:glycine/D-amino acid oxidase-like deaminating enzyme
MSKVGIIGSGFVGRARAISFSRAGHDVTLWDQDPQATEKALTHIRGLLNLGASDLLNMARPRKRAAWLLRSAGHAPIVIKREIDGLVMNRLQGRCSERRFALWPKVARASRISTSAQRWPCAALVVHRSRSDGIRHPGGIGPHPEDVLHMKRTADRLFGSDYKWSVLCTVRNQLSIAAQAAAIGGNVRFVLEDSLWSGPGRFAQSNAEQVRAVRQIIEGPGLSVASPDDAREILQLKGDDRVAF